MQRCPQCGCKDKFNWPVLLMMLAFLMLYLTWMLGDYQPRQLKPVGLAAFVLYSAGVCWMGIRNGRDRDRWQGRVPSGTTQTSEGVSPKLPSQ